MMTLMLPQREVVLVGASIGRNWNIDGFGARRGCPHLKCSYVGAASGFDKGPAVAELTAREHKPGVIIIKQCSVFFPGALNRYKAMMCAWREQIEVVGVQPVFATTIPVARACSAFHAGRGWIRSLIPGLESKMTQIWAFNDWIRAHAQDLGGTVLDLEQALQISSEDRYLSPEFDQGDRVHVNAAGYRAMDEALERTLRSLMMVPEARFDRSEARA